MTLAGDNAYTFRAETQHDLGLFITNASAKDIHIRSMFIQSGGIDGMYVQFWSAENLEYIRAAMDVTDGHVMRETLRKCSFERDERKG